MPFEATPFLRALLAASWQGTLVMLLVLALRPLLGRRVPARWRYLLWTLVLVRLLAPSFILPPSPASLQNIAIVERPGERVTIALDEAYTDYFMGARLGAQEAKPIEPANQWRWPVAHPRFHHRKLSWWQLGAIVWAAGASLLAAWILGATIRLHRRMRGEDAALDEAIAAIWAFCCARFSLRRRPRLLVVRWIGSPALVGVFRPTLLIPEQVMAAFSREDWEHILMHELAHYRRRDHWTHALQLVALCAHWFNPFDWLGFRYLRADRELAADELALERLAGERAVAYGDTLLKVLSAHSTEGFQPGMIGIMDDAAQLKQRLRRIVAFGPSHLIGSFAGLALILVLSAIVLGRASNTADLSAYRNMKPAEILVSAAAKNDLPVLRKILDDGIDLNVVAKLPGETTALAAAAAANHMETLRLLVTKGARINSQDGKSSPALMAALWNGSLECANYLLAKGAACDPQVLADAKSDIADRKTGAYVISTPAERGQILDRNGKVLVTNRRIDNLGIVFPKLFLSDAEVLAFASQQTAMAESLLHRATALSFSQPAILRHYKNRGMLPIDIAENLTAEEKANLKKAAVPGLVVHPVAFRYFPNATLGAPFLGFAYLADRTKLIRSDKVEPVETAGRDGLELTFNDQLAGKSGATLFAFDTQGRKISDTVSRAPQPGNSVVTTIDANIQDLCEKALQEGGRPGAMMIIDPTSGDVLAMASWPTFDPNQFIPSISLANWKALNEDPRHPLVDRTCSAAYPPGSAFKIFVGLAALESGAIKLDEKIPNPPSIQFDDHTFHDWKDSDRGMLTFAEALEQNADSWFYQVGAKTGAQSILDWAEKFGFSRKTGIPLPNEKTGLIPTDEFMKKKLDKHWAELSSGYTANLAIGQGYTSVTPIQMAQAMATLANGGTLHQPRLVKQVQNREGQILGEYHPDPQGHLDIKPEILSELKKAMIAAVQGNQGSAHSAALDGIQVAGVTGSPPWIMGGKEHTAGWFAGFAPAGQPKFAFAAVIEGDPGERASGATAAAAPMVAEVLRQLFASETK
jgi:penicillin-binding protein 2